MITAKDLFIDDDGDLSCSKAYSQKEYNALMADIFNEWKRTKERTLSMTDIDQRVNNYSFQVPYDGGNNFYDKKVARHFRDGIEWTLEQLGVKIDVSTHSA